MRYWIRENNSQEKFLGEVLSYPTLADLKRIYGPGSYLICEVEEGDVVDCGKRTVIDVPETLAFTKPSDPMPRFYIRENNSQERFLGELDEYPTVDKLRSLHGAGRYIVSQPNGISESNRTCIDVPETLVFTTPSDPMLQFFKYQQLPEHLQKISIPFCLMAENVVNTLPRNPERTACLRKLLEAKDCAVRAMIYTDWSV